MFKTVRVFGTFINPIQAGVFWNHIGWGGTLCPPLFLLCLWSNYNQTWHDSTRGQNLSKAIKRLLTSSLGHKYDVIKPFLVSFQVKIRIFLSLAEIWHWGQFWGANFEFEPKKSDINTFEREKMPFFTKKSWKFCPSSFWQVLPWQQPCLLLTENYFKWCPI